jgi:hypothetical protein
VTIDTHAGLRWVSDDVLEVGGTRFLLSVDPDVYTVHPATSREFMLVKRKEMVDWLVDRLPPDEISTILEVGLYKGGSTAFLNALLQPDIHLAVELEPEPLTALDEYAETLASGQLLRFYGVDQADEIGLAGIIADSLGGRPLDLIVDDASHLYRETRSTFEVTFPHLRPGGRYIIEDWNWAHMDEDLWQYAGGYWADRPALTNLIVELLMVAGTDRSAIAEITVDRDMVEVVRGDGTLPTPFRLAASYMNRGLRFRPIL